MSSGLPGLKRRSTYSHALLHILKLHSNVGTCYLHPIEPSHIVIQPGQSIHLPAGSSSLVFYCVAYGFPLPSITWRNSSADLANDSVTTVYSELVNEGGVLVLKSRLEICKAETSNVYTCFGENHLGSENSSTEVIADAYQGIDICFRIITVLKLPYYIHTHTHAHTYTHTYMCVCVYICIYIYIYG